MVGTRVQRAPSLSRTAPGFVVVASQDGRCVEMGGSAAAIWSELPDPDSEPISIPQLVALLVARFGISADTAARDALAVLESLEEIGCAVRSA